MQKVKKGILAGIALILGVAGSQAAEWNVKDSVLVIEAATVAVPAQAFVDREDFHTVRVAPGGKLAEIGEYAFMGCRNLRNVELGNSVRKVGQGAFRECERLVRVAMPGVKVVPRECFSWCVNLKAVELSPRLEDISSQGFSYCRELEEFEFPPTLRHIGGNAFSFCSSLRKADLPDSVEELESYAFSECSSLESVRLPGNGKLLGELIFSGCWKLKEIVEPSLRVPSFDCNSTLFEDAETWLYDECRLMVPSRAASSYRRAEGWKLFKQIEEL